MWFRVVFWQVRSPLLFCFCRPPPNQGVGMRRELAYPSWVIPRVYIPFNMTPEVQPKTSLGVEKSLWTESGAESWGLSAGQESLTPPASSMKWPKYLHSSSLCKQKFFCWSFEIWVISENQDSGTLGVYLLWWGSCSWGLAVRTVTLWCLRISVSSSNYPLLQILKDQQKNFC